MTTHSAPDPQPEDSYGWARTGDLRSRNHLAFIEPYQNRAICGVAITGIGEIRPRHHADHCPRCAREARKLGLDIGRVGIENDLVAG